MPDFFALDEFRDTRIIHVDKDDFCVRSVQVREGCYDVRYFAVRRPFGVVERVTGGSAYRLDEFSGVVGDEIRW